MISMTYLYSFKIRVSMFISLNTKNLSARKKPTLEGVG
nr:MAG TPA: hypothetical protein [Caudoviricetes sp.]